MKSSAQGGSFVDIGLDKLAHLQHCIPPKTRVTLQVGPTMSVRFMQEVSENVIVAEVGGAHANEHASN